MMPAGPPSSALSLDVIIALILGSACAAGGTVLLKMGATGNASLVDYANVRLASGLGFYATGSALWIFAMARAPLSLVYPFNALTFVLVMTASVLLFGERPTPTMIGGSGLILSGIACLTFGAAR